MTESERKELSILAAIATDLPFDLLDTILISRFKALNDLQADEYVKIAKRALTGGWYII